MQILKEYKGIFLSGIAVVLFFVASYFVMDNVEHKSKYAYGEHIFQEGAVSEIDIQIDAADWNDMLENPLEESFHRADLVINGEQIGNVAIRTKGNTSLTSVANSDSDRYSFKIDFDYYDDNGNYYGLKKLCLNNNYADNSNMREYIGYKIMEDMGLPVPQCGYSHITVNGEEWGLYLAVEAADEVFLQTRFADATGDLYKPEGMGGTGADLAYQGDDISAYTNLNLKTNLGTSDGSEIIALMKALESGEGLEEVLDVDNALKYIAANVALANFDSYLGGTTHNYYLYEDNGVFSMIPWDLNLSFGGFMGGKVDIYEPGSGSMGPGGDRNKEQTETDTQPAESEKMPMRGEMPAMGEMPQMPESVEMPEMGERSQIPEGMEMPVMGEMPRMPEGMEMPAMGEMPQMPEGMEMPDMGGMFGGGSKPLVDTLLADEELLARYESYLKEIAETYLTEEYMASMVTEVHDLIAPYVEKDATAFYTYEEFEQGCSIDPEDPYSLVYYAVNMAESIQTQLAGGEPTFDVSSLQGGGMFGGKGGMPGFGGEMPDFGGEMPDFGGEMPDFAGGMPDFGGEMPDFGNMPPMGEGFTPENKGSGEENGGGFKGMPGRPGERVDQVNVKEVLPEMLICGGIFLVGLIIAILYKRKKDLH